MLEFDIAGFNAYLSNWETVTLPAMLRAHVEELSKTFFVHVILWTPRDTGQAQSGWDVSLNDPSTFVPTPGAQSYDLPSIDKVTQAIASLKFGDSVWFVNNVVYINRLNNGWSQQVGADFIGRALQTSIALTQQKMA